MNKVAYLVDSINKHVSIDFEEESDLIPLYSDKLLEISAMIGRKIALVDGTYPEVFEQYDVRYIRMFNNRLTIVTVPNERVKELTDFYKALDLKCVVSF